MSINLALAVMERRSVPEANRFCKLQEELLPFQGLNNFPCIYERDYSLFRSSNNFVWIPEGDYSLSQGQAFECFNFARAPKLEVVAVWSGH